METTNFSKETVTFSKNAVKTGFDTLSTFSDQAVAMSDFFLTASPSVSEEGKKAIGIYCKESQKSLVNLKKHLESGLDLDWSAKDAPVKNLEVLESFYNAAFSQATGIKKETKTLVDNAAKQLPKEAKSIVDFWFDSFNYGFESFQSVVNKNFELARKIVTTDASVIAPSVQPKAAK
ncbi:MAG: hypothetical protein WCP20_03460 [Desulfuromonadales bacterium]